LLGGGDGGEGGSGVGVGGGSHQDGGDDPKVKKMEYVRNVVKEYLVTNDWATQDSLVPVIGGFRV
jgi:hypothetical protein